MSTKPFISNLVENLGADPRFKFARIISTPEMPDEHIAFTKDTWSSVLKRGYSMLVNGSNESKINRTDKILLKIKSFITVCRGENLDEFSDEIFQNLKNKYKIHYNNYLDNNNLHNFNKHLTIINNSDFLSSNMKNSIDKAYEMLAHNAFLHQYEKYGMNKEDFIEALAFCEQIVYDYKTY